MKKVEFPRFAYLNIFLIVIWSLTFSLNLLAHNNVAASMNLLCVVLWSLSLCANLWPWYKYKKAMKAEKQAQDAQHAKEQFERLQQQEKIARMDFMKVAEMNARQKNAK